MPITGEVVYLRVFDLGGTIDMKKARSIFPALTESVQSTRAAPEYVSFAAPIPIGVASLNLRVTTDAGAPVSLSARLYEVGAVAFMLRLNLSGELLSELSRYHNLPMRLNGEPMRRAQIFSTVFSKIAPLLVPALDEIFAVPVEAEPYITFCMTEIPGGAERVFRDERAHIAGLLIGESQPERLAHSEIEDTLRNWSSYYKDDLAIADWDAAFLVEPTAQYEDMLYIFEVANLQLLALRKYDLYLDSVLERGYDEYERLSKGPPFGTARAREMVRELSEIRMDLAKVTDEVANTGKFFGDWYAARVYMGLAQKLHIADYHKVVEEKLATLNDLYQSVLSEVDRRQNLALEVAVVLLIIFEVGVALWRH